MPDQCSCCAKEHLLFISTGFPRTKQYMIAIEVSFHRPIKVKAESEESVLSVP